MQDALSPALITLIVVSLLPLSLAVLGGYCRWRQLGSLDNHYPRLQQNQLTGLAARVLAAQQNAWEALALFGSSVLIAHLAEVPMTALSTSALLFLACRALHALCYLADWANLRSLVFSVGLGCCLYIDYLALSH